MKKPLILTIFLFIVTLSFSQTNEYKDYIVKVTGDTIFCKIGLVNNYNIFYEYKKKRTIESSYISLDEVVLFSKDNQINNKEDIDKFKKSGSNSNANYKLPFDTIIQKVVFKKIIELHNDYTSEHIYSAVREWFSTNSKIFNRSNSDKNTNAVDVLLGIERANSVQLDQLHKNDQPLKLESFDEKKLIGKGILKYTGTSLGCIRILYTEYDIKVFIKDSKLKIEITNVNYVHYNQISMKQSAIFGTDNGSCGSKNNIEELLNCKGFICGAEMDNFFIYFTDEVNDTFNNLNKFIIDNKKRVSDDDW
jgi:hypothetical protein